MSLSALPQLLLVDDEAELRDLLAEFFAREGFAVRQAADAAQARLLIAENLPDMALLDLKMPGEGGLSLARWLREQHPQVAIIVVTAASDAVDRVIGLEQGADDYVSKPFDLRELLARTRAVMRRTRASIANGVNVTTATAAPEQAAAGSAAVEAPSPRVPFGACHLDLEQRKLFDGQGQELPLTPAEYDLLALFAHHPNRPLHRDEIMAQAHKRDWDVFDRSIDLRIMRLRRKVERNPDKPEVLRTIRNIGYMFVRP